MFKIFKFPKQLKLNKKNKKHKKIKNRIEDLPINNNKLIPAFSQALLEKVRNVVNNIINKGIRETILFFISLFSNKKAIENGVIILNQAPA